MSRTCLFKRLSLLSESQYSVLLHYRYSCGLMRMYVMYVHVYHFLSSINHHLWSREKFLAVPWGSMHRQPPGDLGQNASKCDPSTLRTYCLRDETRRYKYKRKQEDTKVLNQGCQLQSSSEKSITVLWRPRSSNQFLLQDASWMSMCFGCDHEKVWTESLSIVGTQQSSSMFANQPTQESWCEGDRSDQRLHLNAIFSCLVETTTFRVAHTTPKDVWSLYEAMCIWMWTYKVHSSRFLDSC